MSICQKVELVGSIGGIAAVETGGCVSKWKRKHAGINTGRGRNWQRWRLAEKETCPDGNWQRRKLAEMKTAGGVLTFETDQGGIWKESKPAEM